MTYKQTYAYQRTKNLVDYIRQHGIEAHVVIKRDATYKIKALAVYQDSEQWETLKPDYDEVRAWLGY